MNKPNALDATFFALPAHGVAAISGRDALAFAQAQFMSDVGTLVDRQWQWSGWLTPKGRLIALFVLLRVDAETLWLVLPDADAEDVVNRLQRFVFRSKLAINVRNDLAVSGAFASPRRAQGAQAAFGREGSAELDVGGDGGGRTLRIATGNTPADPDAVVCWTGADMAHGLPRLAPGNAEQWTPQQLSLDRLGAYSVKKGCYPGQEIVARTHFLGQAKRGLVLLESEVTLDVGAEVREGCEVIGKAVSVAGGLGLAVLPMGREFTSLSVDGTPVRERPLQGGLGR